MSDNFRESVLDRWEWKLIFGDNQVTLQMSEINHGPEITITGRLEE